MEKHLINTTEVFQKFVRINISVLRQSFLPYEFDARHKFIIPYIGSELHEELISLYNDGTYPAYADTQSKEKILDHLLHHCQNSLAMFTLYLAAPHMDLHLSEMGFVVTNSTNAAPASSQRVKSAVDAALAQGYDRLETMLRYLEKYHTSIPSYSVSEARVFETDNIISSALEFDQILPISKSRLRFVSLKPEMQNIRKLQIEPLISIEMFCQLVNEKRNLAVSDDNRNLLKFLQPSIAYFATANTLDQSNAHYHLYPMLGLNQTKEITQTTIINTIDRFRSYGNNYLNGALKLLNAHPDKYPTYKHSQQYYNNQKNKPFHNDNTPVFIFGHP